jgi:hypothetical protein
MPLTARSQGTGLTSPVGLKPALRQNAIADSLVPATASSRRDAPLSRAQSATASTSAKPRPCLRAFGSTHPRPGRRGSWLRGMEKGSGHAHPAAMLDGDEHRLVLRAGERGGVPLPLLQGPGVLFRQRRVEGVRGVGERAEPELPQACAFTGAHPPHFDSRPSVQASPCSSRTWVVRPRSASGLRHPEAGSTTILGPNWKTMSSFAEHEALGPVNSDGVNEERLVFESVGPAFSRAMIPLLRSLPG